MPRHTKTWLLACLALTQLAHASGIPARVVIIPLDSAPTIQASILWRGDWMAAEAYAVGEAVAYGGSSYLCIKAHQASPGNAPPGNGNWHLLAARGEPGPTGPQGPSGVTTAGAGLRAEGDPQDLTLGVDFANLVTPSGIRIESTGDSVTVQANGGEITIAADGSISISTIAPVSVNTDSDVSVSGRDISLDALNAISFTVGATNMTLKESSIALAASQVSVAATGDLDLAAVATLALGAGQSVTADVGSSALGIDATGISLDAIQVDVQGGSTTSIASPLTRIDGSAVLDLNGGIIQLN
jgi:hypothetical protein